MKKRIAYLRGMQAVAWIILVKLASFLKINFIIGSQLAHFSAVSIVTPLVGLFGGIVGCWIVLFIKMALGLWHNSFGSFQILAFYVPGFCASLYLAEIIVDAYYEIDLETLLYPL